MKALEVV